MIKSNKSSSSSSISSRIKDSQQSWASTLSDYIIKRRQQTYTAYVGDTNTRSTDGNGKLVSQEWLFKSLLMAFAKQLEEGHTVLTLMAHDREKPIEGSVAKVTVLLYQWQYDLLDILVGPLLEVVDSHLTDEDHAQDLEEVSQEDKAYSEPNPTIFNVLDTLIVKGTQLWLQSDLSSNDKAILVERYHLIKHIYELMIQLNGINTELVSAVESLKLFQQVISDHPLFTYIRDKNSLSKSNQNPINIHSESTITQTPLIFQSYNDNNQFYLTFWLHRTWQAEYNLAHKILHIWGHEIAALPIDIPDNLNTQQVRAVQVANENAFSIITGGPGTGKTYTVAQLVIALQKAQEDKAEGQEVIRFSTDSARLALAAPTGKAAQRMQQSLQAALNHADVEVQLQEAKTIHRLLGIGRDGRPRYHADNPLGEDIIIVDEASMLGVELANYLVSAVKPGARLILLGDANQLAAVDAGAVLADLCHIPVLQPIHVRLTESKRFNSDSGIGKLAAKINEPNTDNRQIWQLIRQDASLDFRSVIQFDYDKISNQENTEINSLSNSKNNNQTIQNNKFNQTQNLIIKEICTEYSDYLNKIKELMTNPIAKSIPEEVSYKINDLMAEFNRFRILTAGHHGEWGDDNINAVITNWHKTMLKLPIGKSSWFHGRPIMVLQNNYELGLYNGDIGICLLTEGDANRLEVFFENKSQGIAVNLLNEELVSTAYAMTIHKSQGSEFDHVAITFDSSHSRLLSKELIYTAVTRAKSRVTIYSTKQALEKAVQTPTERHTGLGLQFG